MAKFRPMALGVTVAIPIHSLGMPKSRQVRKINGYRFVQFIITKLKTNIIMINMIASSTQNNDIGTNVMAGDAGFKAKKVPTSKTHQTRSKYV